MHLQILVTASNDLCAVVLHVKQLVGAEPEQVKQVWWQLTHN